jgi:outer membrane protein TolC
MKKLITAILIFFAANTSNAQQSMMQDVSMPYLDKLVEAARANYPKFKWSEAKVNVAKANVTRTKLSYLDVLTASYIYNPRNSVSLYTPTTTTGTTGSGDVRNNNLIQGYQVGVFVNVGVLAQKPSQVRMAKEELNAARYDRDAMYLNLETEVKNRYFNYVQQTNMLKLSTKAVLDAESALTNMKFKFEKGQVTFDSYNQVLMSHANFTQQKIATEAAVLMAKASLEEILGTDLENIK